MTKDYKIKRFIFSKRCSGEEARGVILQLFLEISERSKDKVSRYIKGSLKRLRVWFTDPLIQTTGLLGI